jgi:hypothetical protein
MMNTWHCDTSGTLIGTVLTESEDCYVTSSSSASLGMASTTEAVHTVAFGLAILIGIAFLMVVGFMFNTMSNKKPWS